MRTVPCPRLPALAEPEVRKELWRTWARLFERFREAHEACLASLSERNVHRLRVCIRHCDPVLTILRMVEPDNGSWRLAQHGGRDLARALAPLRDLQVRRALLSRKVRDGSRLARAMLRIRAEEQSARRSAREALRLFVAMPEDGLRRCTRRSSYQRTSIWTSQVREAVRKSREELWGHWRQARRLEPADLHGLRVALKRYRYLLLSLEPCLTEALRRSLPALERMQDELGAWHDGQVLSDWMRSHRGTTGMAILNAEQEARLQAISKMLSEPVPV